MKRVSRCMALLLVVLASMTFSCSQPQSGGPGVDPRGSLSADKVEPYAGPLGSATLTVFIMSKCPFCGRALPAIEEAVARFDGAVRFRLEFVVNAEGGRLSTLHGEEELAGDLLLACAQERVQDKSHFMKLLLCMEGSFREIPDNFAECGREQLSADEEAATVACAQGSDGVSLLMDSAKRSKEASVRGAPTFFIGDVEYSGGRSVEDFVAALCEGMDQRHPVCSTL